MSHFGSAQALLHRPHSWAGLQQRPQYLSCQSQLAVPHSLARIFRKTIMGLPSFSALRCHFAHALGDVSCDTTGAVDSGYLHGLPVTAPQCWHCGVGVWRRQLQSWEHRVAEYLCRETCCSGQQHHLQTPAWRCCLGSLYFSELPSQNGLLIP